MALTSGKPSMRKGPTHRDLPFGQMIFPEMCQLLCAAAVATAIEIQRQPNPLQPMGLTSNTDCSQSAPSHLFLLRYIKKKKKKASVHPYWGAWETKAALKRRVLHRLIISNHITPIISSGDNHLSPLLKSPESGLSRQGQTYISWKEEITRERGIHSVINTEESLEAAVLSTNICSLTGRSSPLTFLVLERHQGKLQTQAGWKAES